MDQVDTVSARSVVTENPTGGVSPVRKSAVLSAEVRWFGKVACTTYRSWKDRKKPHSGRIKTVSDL